MGFIISTPKTKRMYSYDETLIEFIAEIKKSKISNINITLDQVYYKIHELISKAYDDGWNDNNNDNKQKTSEH